jgi:hypothetical protein
MHKRRAGFDPLKFTPSIIANKKNIDDVELLKYFNDNHSLADCANRFHCSQITIKRRLRSQGIDTSKYNHSELSKTRSAQKLYKQKPSTEHLIDLYINKRRDSKSIAEMYGLHYNTIRKQINKLGLKKTASQHSASQVIRHHSMHGCDYPAQRPDVVKKTRRSTVKVSYTDKLGRTQTFRSIHELCFAILLDQKSLEWYYEEMSIPYVDMLNGKRRNYIIDFTVISDQKVEWVEVKPQESMIPMDKRIYAERRAESAGVIYRGLSESERSQGWKLFTDGLFNERLTFHQLLPAKAQKKITYWFKNKHEADSFSLYGWKKSAVLAVGSYFKGVLRKL